MQNNIRCSPTAYGSFSGCNPDAGCNAAYKKAGRAILPHHLLVVNPVGENLSKFIDFRRHDKCAIALQWILPEIILVVLLGFVISFCRT